MAGSFKEIKQMKRIIIMMSLISSLFAFLGCDKQPDKSTQQETFAFYVQIPERILPLERGEKYEEPLNDYLVAQGLGEVVGGGTMLTKENEIEYIGLDVDIIDPDKAIPLMIEKLKELGVPEGTVLLQYEPVERTIKVK